MDLTQTDEQIDSRKIPDIAIIHSPSNGPHIKHHDGVAYQEDREYVDDKDSKCKSSLGIILSILGAMSYSWTIVATNYLSQYDYFAAGMYRGIFVVLPCLTYIAWQRLSVFPWHRMKLITFRSVAGVLGSGFCFVAVQALPVAESSTLLQMTPVFVSILSIIFMKEKCTIFTTVIILFTMVGVVLVSNPLQMISGLENSSVDRQLIGISSAIADDLLYAGIFIALRSLRDVSPSVIILHVGMVTTVVSIVGCLVKNELRIPTGTIDLILLTSVGLSFLLGQIFISTAVRYETSVVVSMVQVSQVLFCCLLQIFVLQQPIGLIEAVGVTVIALSMLCLGFQRYVTGLPDKSSLRKKYGFLLR